MTLCILGAGFILGRIRIETATIPGEANGAEVLVSIASLNFLLVLIGTAFASLAVLSNPAVTLTDGRAFAGSEDSRFPGVV